GRAHGVLRALERDQALLAGGQVAAVRVAAGKVGAQCAALRGARIDQARDVVRHQPARSGGDEQAERMGADERVLNLDPILAKGWRLIHASGSGRSGYWSPASWETAISTRP